jgi:peptide/nickel transport system permease protein
MLTFLLKRLLHTIPILLGVSLLTFMLMSLTPGDYYTQLSQNPQITPEKLAELRAKQHLDRPWYVRYGYWLKDAAHGDLGYSIAYKISVSRLIMDRLWNTFLLSAWALILAWGVAVPLGIWAALNKDSWVDRLCGMIAFVGLSVPDILLALLALMFAAGTGLLPVGGLESPTYDLMTTGQQILDHARHLILPVIVLAAGDLAGIMRQMRSNFLDTMRAEFVTTARAKGMAEGWVIYKHTLRNAINPLLTIFGYSLAGLLSGAFIVENIMAWPGLGRLTMDALNARDYPLVVASVVMAAALLVAGNFVADLLLAWSDPRIRLNK